MKRRECMMLKPTYILLMILIPVLGNGIPIAFAQKVTSYTFDQQVYYQGDSGTLTVVLYNDQRAFQISTKQFYLQFDWQEAQKLVYDSGKTPNIASGQSYTFRIQFSIPSSVAVGPHRYKVVWVDKGILLGTRTVVSEILQIHDAYEKVYNSLLPSANSKLSQTTGYKSPEGKSLVQQASSSMSVASSLAQQGQWKEAVDKLKLTIDQFDQASAAEQIFLQREAEQLRQQQQQQLQQEELKKQQQEVQQQNTMIYGGIGALVIIGIMAFALVRRRRSKSSTNIPAKQSSPEEASSKRD